MKKQSNFLGLPDAYYFWRTHTGQEIDIIKESEGKLTAIECKWSERRITIPPSLWQRTYPNADFMTLTSENYLDYLMV